MDMRGLGFAALASVVWVVPTHFAAAADAFLCGTDNVVYVEIEDLEAAKRTDPCVASYYGLKVDGSIATQTPLPLKPVIATPPAITVPIRLRSTMVDVPRSRVAKSQPVSAAAPPVPKPPARSPIKSDVPVRIINASTSQTTWSPLVKPERSND